MVDCNILKLTLVELNCNYSIEGNFLFIIVNNPFRSEADPGVLAKYVIALLKKDESSNQEVFIEQLEVFLDDGKGTYYILFISILR